MKLPVVISFRKRLADAARCRRGASSASVVAHVLEVHEDALRRLGAQEGRRWRSSSTGPTKRLEHEVELPRLGDLAAAVRTLARFLQEILAETVVTLLALHQRIGKAGDVARRLHTLGCIRIEASRPTVSLRPVTTVRHHASLTLRLSSTPTGP